MDQKHGTLIIDNDKLQEAFTETQKQLVDTVSKLHLTNKARHETDVKLGQALKQIDQINDKLRHSKAETAQK